MKELLQQKAWDYAVKHSSAPDKETPDWIITDYLAGAKEILDNPELYGLMKANKKGNCSLCNGTGNMTIDRDVSEYYKDEN